MYFLSIFVVVAIKSFNQLLKRIIIRLVLALRWFVLFQYYTSQILQIGDTCSMEYYQGYFDNGHLYKMEEMGVQGTRFKVNMQKTPTCSKLVKVPLAEMPWSQKRECLNFCQCKSVQVYSYKMPWWWRSIHASLSQQGSTVGHQEMSVQSITNV